MQSRNEMIRNNQGGADTLPKIVNKNHNHLPDFHKSMKKSIVDFSNQGEQMSNDARQKPVQISTEFHAKLLDLAEAQGRNMKWIIEDALKSKYPAFKELSK